ncbi:uncharacterized protein K02A2.6-like [Gymnodraco acuticeps]|uniref:ribonuclease H n=1 Tax=Gymnodraco acuticeps TaxID=8218 RepID=A0A6P8W2I4_GYMAC|nr:uncharacterized protein K02A2.6-like [Gymnodraco acuticeps]
MLIGKELMKFQIDCGASCNVIPVNLLSPETRLESTKTVLVMYNKTRLHPLGKCKVKVRNPRNQKQYRLEFEVVNEDCRLPLLGKKASEAMKLIKVQYENILAIDSIVTEVKSAHGGLHMQQIQKEYSDVFTGDGCLEGEYKIEIDERVEPVKLPKRRVPVAMMTPLKLELQDLQRREIITPVEKSTDWISSLVTVQKPNGKPRICIDPRPLNKALKRSHFPLPTIDDILPDLSRAKVFTVCDVKHGFWHVKLEESSYLTTFATPFGRFRWLKMPMGISPAPEIFQRMLNQALEGLPGIYIIADDVLITGEDDTQEMAFKDHDDTLRQFLSKCREKNIKLNAEKFRLRQQEVPYIGHLLTADGLKIDPEKIRAVRDMPRPTDVKGVQRLMGMVNDLSKFYKHLSDDCEIVRQLTHKENMWEWTGMHEEAFSRLKDNIAKTPVLKYYDPQEDLTLQCDASALTQKGKPYSSQEFQRFSRPWEFEHKTSSPGYPQSNGKAESAVKTAKRLMLKAKAAGQEPYLAMLDHRNTPTQGLTTSPAQGLLSRRTRTLLPTWDSLLQPEVKQTTQEQIDRQEKQATYYNRTAKDMDMLKQGDRVRVQPYEPHTIWRTATVVEPVDTGPTRCSWRMEVF